MTEIKKTQSLLQFSATSEKGEVSAMLKRPENATHLLVLGHGASSNMRTPMMESIAEALGKREHCDVSI